MDKILVKNLRDAEEYCKQEHKEKSVMISITTPPNDAKVFASKENGIKDILTLQFEDYDICDDIKHRDEPWYEALMKDTTYITNEQAQKIALFVDKWICRDVTIIVHCEGGVSRSAAVAAAIKKAYFKSGNDILKDPKYDPNRTVYRKVLDCIYKLNPSLVYNSFYTL